MFVQFSPRETLATIRGASVASPRAAMPPPKRSKRASVALATPPPPATDDNLGALSVLDRGCLEKILGCLDHDALFTVPSVCKTLRDMLRGDPAGPSIEALETPGFTRPSSPWTAQVRRLVERCAGELSYYDSRIAELLESGRLNPKIETHRAADSTSFSEDYYKDAMSWAYHPLVALLSARDMTTFPRAEKKWTWKGAPRGDAFLLTYHPRVVDGWDACNHTRPFPYNSLYKFEDHGMCSWKKQLPSMKALYEYIYRFGALCYDCWRYQENSNEVRRWESPSRDSDGEPEAIRKLTKGEGVFETGETGYESDESDSHGQYDVFLPPNSRRTNDFSPLCVTLCRDCSRGYAGPPNPSRRLLTATDAKRSYCLRPADIEPLPHAIDTNPIEAGFAPMKLYRKVDVVAAASSRWKTREKLDAEIHERLIR